MAAVIGGAAAPASAGDDYVKYYVVNSSYQGKPENLTEIAGRFLGDGARSVEIFNLNSGRKQPDGGRLTDASSLRAGWVLSLPWDGYGDEVKYGVLPDKVPSAPTKPKPKNDREKSAPKSPPKVPQAQVGAASKVPSKPPKQPRASKKGPCATGGSGGRSDWASLRLAAERAWPQSRGKGQRVAVIDSGVDGSLAPLSGHVAVGMDIVNGSGRGDTDCLGSGTAMAGLIVGQQGGGAGVKGVAPDCIVMPVRVTGADAKAQPADGASAIEAAVGAGATVIALGKYVDTAKPEVAKAMMAAVDRDVVVVSGASLGSVPINPDAKIGAGVLRVAGVGMDSQRAADYRSGGIDVVAPGINVSSIGITGVGSVAGSGTEYAVALTAGVAALVRAAYPDLTAQQVAQRLKLTSDKLSDSPPPDGRFGWGMINPAAAVTKVLPQEVANTDGAPREHAGKLISGSSGTRSTLLAVVTLVALAAALLLVFRIRRLLRDQSDEDDDDGGGPGPVATAPPAYAGHLPPAAAPLAPTVSRKPEHEAPPVEDEPDNGAPVTVPAGQPRDDEAEAAPKASVGGRSSQQRPETP
ncbi:S8 family serine peptidase [Actinoplanes sp. NBRC 103695]|uniref:S8 family serine peptidase n=1 Tax=Actinoplanes sp. NBRC 103695 TaxID=3032202 RepID=UPI0025546325|nr:S8 family serine peptidase [Actinoplanes sp. NBRC 103695]